MARKIGKPRSDKITSRLRIRATRFADRKKVANKHAAKGRTYRKDTE
jgi:hypothetical protein